MIFKKSISTKTLIQMGLRIAAIISLSTVIGYWHLVKTIEARAKVNVKHFVAERGERESLVFDEAVDHHKIMIGEFLRLYQEYLHNPQTPKLFNRLAKMNNHGVWRNKDPQFNGKKDAGIFLSTSNPDLDLQARFLAAYDVTSRFGLPFHDDFQDLYFTFPENGIVLFWPEVPKWVQDTKDDEKIISQEYYTVAAENNPKHTTRWSGLFYDAISSAWMVTASTPIYVQGKHVANVHHDLLVNEIFDRTIDDRLTGADSYFIVRGDGRLIMHPDHTGAIKTTNGHLEVLKSGDHELISQFNEIKKMTDRAEVIDSPEGKDYLAVAKIEGPDWYLVTSYPLEPLRAAAARNAVFILISGFISLLIEITMLYLVLRKQISIPLKQLNDVTKKIAKGNFERINIHRQDEFGDLVTSFNEMVLAIKKRDGELARHNHNLEQLIEQRTLELDQQKAITLQASKMSALGEMAGGIAHEINTPLATIQMIASGLIHEIQNDIPDLDNLSLQLQQIEKTCDRVAKIINGLRTFARDGSTDPFEVVSVQQLIDDTVALCTEQLKRHKIDLRLNVKSDNILVSCRPIQICQVLLNLIGNAKDAVENADSKWIQLDAYATADAAEFRVIDGGPGIPKSLQEKIFQPFYTTKTVGKGTGMGLSISLGIVKAHSGGLSIDNSQSHTCFVLKLPLAQSQAA